MEARLGVSGFFVMDENLLLYKKRLELYKKRREPRVFLERRNWSGAK